MVVAMVRIGIRRGGGYAPHTDHDDDDDAGNEEDDRDGEDQNTKNGHFKFHDDDSYYWYRYNDDHDCGGCKADGDEVDNNGVH